MNANSEMVVVFILQHFDRLIDHEVLPNVIATDMLAINEEICQIRIFDQLCIVLVFVSQIIHYLEFIQRNIYFFSYLKHFVL